jgi:tRNA(adenine34) deaminase
MDVAAPETGAVGAVATGPKTDPATRPSGDGSQPQRWRVTYTLLLGAALIVIIIVAIARSNGPGTSAIPPLSTSSAAHPPVQVSSTVVKEFTTISKTLDAANLTVSKALASSTGQSVAQVTADVAPYVSALDAFDYDSHLINWPAAMQVPAQRLSQRTQYLAAFLATASSNDATGLASWLAQIHTLAQSTQVADNAVRHDIGIPTTRSYPWRVGFGNASTAPYKGAITDTRSTPAPPPLSDHAAMALALEEALEARAHADVPVGAVVLVDGVVVAARHNERERTGDPTAHAEILALRDAAAALGGWRLSTATLVVTLEPCPMCAGALVAARLGRLVFGAADPRAGACGTLYNLCCDPRLNHEVPVVSGVREAECAMLLTSFFAGKRPKEAGLTPGV